MNRQQFVTDLRIALTHLDDFQSLRQNSLLALLCPAERIGSPVALQARLVDAITALKDEGGSHASRFADVLYYRYIEHLGPADVAFQMGISERQLRREQTNAIELLAERLWQSVSIQTVTTLQHEFATAAGEEHDDALHTEVNWLRQQFSAESCQINMEMAKAVQEARTLAEKYKVLLCVAPTDDIGTAALPTVALRQALLTILTTLIPRAGGGELHLIQEATPTAVVLRITVKGKPGGMAVDETYSSALHIARQLLLPFGGDVHPCCSRSLSVRLVAPTLKSVSVLLVDDNPDAGQLFQRYVANSRFRLIITSEPRQAIPLVQEHNIQAAVLDIMMPYMDGWDLLAQLRHHPASQHLPIAICTILPQQELSHLLGAHLFVSKPVSQPQFLEMLQLLLASPVKMPV